MIAKRFIFLFMISLFLSSCREMKVHEVYTPEWHPPQGPNAYYVYPPEQKQLPSIESEPTMEAEEEVVVAVKRDTIEGIAVRAPGKIMIEESPLKPGEREADEEAFYAVSYISSNRYLGVNFDNDIFNNTDYYYTNGIRIDYAAPIFASSPFAYSMLPYRKLSMNYHGMTVVQNMYTPTNPDTVMLLTGDRPFAAYLYLGHYKNTLSSRKRYRQYSELQFGLIGPGSLGGFVQGQIHDIPPLGWENQIQNDLVLNYTALIEKGLYNPGAFDLNVFAKGQLGTLYTNAGGGMRIRAGRMNSYFGMPWLASPKSIEGQDGHKWQYGIFATGMVKMVAYDATLQGGVFNNSSNYTIPAEDIERLVLQASAGFFVAFRQMGLMYEQFYISPEFNNGLHHKWGRINVTFCF